MPNFWQLAITPILKIHEFSLGTVFPRIVSAETILFWKLECGKYSREETAVFLLFTLSVIHSESRTPKQVTMKANFIHTWSVESEFVIKNSIFPWTSELVWIWQFLRKFGSFWALLHWQHLVGESFFNRNWTNIWLQNCLFSFLTSVTSANSDVQGKIKFFITNSDSTLQLCMKFAFIVTCLVFLDSEWIKDNMFLD